MKKSGIVIGIATVIVAIGLGTGLIVTNEFSKNHSYSVSESEIATNTVRYKDGSYYYQNQQKNLVADSESSRIFYNNVINALLVSKTTDEEAQKIADIVNGKIIGCIIGEINCLQIMVPDSSFEQLEMLSEKLMESDYVRYAAYDFPMGMELSDSNPWEEQGEEHSDLNNDANMEFPDGNDWWAESIGAYTAWNYVDHFPDELADISVGVIDSEINENHEDFLDSNGHTKIKILDEQRGLYPRYDHGTLVTGIIAAENNTKGIRGVADSSRVLFSSAGRYSVTELKDNNREGKTNGVDLIEFVNTFNSMIEAGARVINYSWGTYIYTDCESYYNHLEEDYNTYRDSYTIEDWISAYGPLFGDYVTELNGDKKLSKKRLKSYKKNLYESFLNMEKQKNEEEAHYCIGIIESLISSGKEDVLFVQAAGNGNAGLGEEGADSTLNGAFASITEDTFNSYSGNHINDIPDLFSKIRNYIICVSGYAKDNPNVVYKGLNYGKGVDLVAPGMAIYSTTAAKNEPNTEETDKYDLKSGTSLAAPIVTGSAAVLWSIDPAMTNAEVKDLLIRNSREGKPGEKKDTVETYHMINLGAAANELIHKKKGSVSILVTDEEGNHLSDYSIDMTTEYSDDPFFNCHYDNINTNTITLSTLGKCTIIINKDGYNEERLELDIKPQERIPIVTVQLVSSTVNWQEAYYEFLCYYSPDVYYAPGYEPRFILAHIDNDDIPELVILPPPQNFYFVELYSMRDGEVVKLGEPYGTMGYFVYSPYMNMMKGGRSIRGELYQWFMEINGNSINDRAFVETILSYDGVTETEQSTYYLNDSVVSADELNQFLSMYSPVVSVGFERAYTRAYRNTDRIMYDPDSLLYENLEEETDSYTSSMALNF